MADYPILTSPDGSTSFNVGSVMTLDPEPDYGMAGMFTNGMGGNPFADGGNLGFRFSGPRMFKLPIRLATVGNLTPAGVAKTLALIAQPGAWIDLILQGVATADAVRFDVIDGRVRQSQNVKMWAGAGRREGMLELDVQPYGYLPTWITLASVPSIAYPGRIAIPGASILGDVPGLAQLNVFAYLPSQQFGSGTYGLDSFYYSLANKMPAFVPPASMAAVFTAAQGAISTLTAAADAPASQVQRIFITPSISAYYGVQGGFYPFISAPLENASYFGRYRVHALARYNAPSSGGAIPIAAEFTYELLGAATGLASGGILASIGQPLTLASDGAYAAIPSGFGFFPLGDVTIPTPIGPNTALGARSIKLWGVVPTFGLATHTMDIGGLWLQSIDGGQGVITRDLQSVNAVGATYSNPFPFAIDAYLRDVQLGAAPSTIVAASIPLIWMASQSPIKSMLDRYRGVMPQVTPSVTGLDFMFGARMLQVAYKNEVLRDTPKLWWRFNEASGLATVQDWSGNGFHGAASNMILGASSLLYGEPGGATGATSFARTASGGISLPAANAPRTLEAWYMPATSPGAAARNILALGDHATAMSLTVVSTAITLTTGAGGPSFPYILTPGQAYHIAAAYDATNVSLYVNGQGQGTKTFAAALNTFAELAVGNFATSGAGLAFGSIDEVAVYPSSLSAARILAHYVAGRNTQGATSAPVYHQGGYAGMSLRYQPRFTFQKEI